MNRTRFLPSRRWLDRWGHFVLWVGPYILVTSLVAWTPRLILFLCGVELFQFTLHASRHHANHPISRIHTFCLCEALVLLIVGFLTMPASPWLALIVFAQIGFSHSVHTQIHMEPPMRTWSAPTALACIGLFGAFLLHEQLHGVFSLTTFLP